MSTLHRWQISAAALIAATLMAGCGGGGGGNYGGGSVVNPSPDPTPITPVEPGSPPQTNNVATDGANWINFRRMQIGIPVLARSGLIDSAAQNHSDYQRINNLVTHDEIAGRSGFTGVTLLARLNHVGYTFTGGYAYGEVISASNSSSGSYLAEELITAIYHRFVIFEPRFKEIGAGSAANGSYNYLTINFTANNGYGIGLGSGQLVTWPVNNAVGVTRNFMSDFESPDPVAGLNEVGYPVSVHADIDANLVVTSFTMKPRGGSDLNVKLLATSAGDIHTPDSAAAIVPLAKLAASTIYDVSFAGTSDGIPVSKTWSFTTKP